jgi:hypothetical protein
MTGRVAGTTLSLAAAAACLATPSAARAESGHVFPASIAFLALSCASSATDIGLVAATGVDLGRARPDRTLGRATLGMGVVGALAGLGAVITGGWMTRSGCDTDPDLCDGENDFGGWGTAVAVTGAVGVVLGIATAIVGARDADRDGQPWAAALPKPVVMRDRRGGQAPGLAWTVAW